MSVVVAPEALDNLIGPVLFLAGGITDCPDWQAEASAALAGSWGTVLNPRRENFPIHDPSAGPEQIAWEHEGLRRAEVILFWFPAESIQPIAMYELGAWSMTDKPLIVGRHPDYPRALDVDIQTRLARPDVLIARDFEELLRRAGAPKAEAS